MYQISEQLIKFNRSWSPLSPQGFVIHSTATPGATAQNERDYFNSKDRRASSHYFVDATGIIRCIPESERAWHAGATANSKFLSVEMCEVEPFMQVWSRTIWLVADACVRYGWTTGPNVFSHRGISAMYGETNHTDPIEFLSKHDKTWDQLLSAIDAEIAYIQKGFVEVIDDPDVWISVRVRTSKVDALMAQLLTDGYANKKLELA
jgi:N-acetylmuramoyl-L-alanine amidase